jgi:branched-subunit amino acid aminotransferase/4-amino-4-deoxychorismate lyase
VPAKARAVGAEFADDDGDEVFITSIAGGVMPVARIDDAPVADGR